MPVNEELFQLFPSEALVTLNNLTSQEIVLNSRQTLKAGDHPARDLVVRHMGWRLQPGVDTVVLKRDWDAEVAKGTALTGPLNIDVVDTFEPDTVTVHNTSTEEEVVLDDGYQGVRLAVDDTPGAISATDVSEQVWDRAQDLDPLAPIEDAGRVAYSDPDEKVLVDNPTIYDVILQEVGRHRGPGVKVPAGAVNFPVLKAIWDAPENPNKHGLTL